MNNRKQKNQAKDEGRRNKESTKKRERGEREEEMKVESLGEGGGEAIENEL